MSFELENDVWKTLNKGIEVIGAYKVAKLNRSNADAVRAQTVQLAGISAARDVAVATRATPSGVLAQYGYNPYPGASSSFPQNDGKHLDDGSTKTMFGFGIMIAIVLVVLGLMVRR